MFKNESGERKFSFTRFISNAVPNVAGAPQDIELSREEKDLIFIHQFNEPDPLILSPEAFRYGGIDTSSKVAASIHKAMLQNGVLEKDTHVINTAAITRSLAHQVPSITSHAQKKLINLLFFWEEEVERWNRLTGEQEALRVSMDAEKERSLAEENRLAELARLLKLRPSERLT
ncbi:hypothetical protein FB567DRAFT_117040 [Paraphoma chrysanthemicola]|uniref:Uncharacterized protein n=1 Tax=Paraphoma chrysanthemicola TaxID=798071 RepID=A0A8K0VVV4_9PLEO|nr:hypothetical protein FB567DRAFT_117040 [Paraphoma chrysanthemicola]